MANPGGRESQIEQSRQQSVASPRRKRAFSRRADKSFNDNGEQAENDDRPAIANEIMYCVGHRMPISCHGSSKNKTGRKQESTEANTGREIPFFRDGNRNAPENFQRNPQREQAGCSERCGKRIVPIGRAFSKVCCGEHDRHGKNRAAGTDERGGISSLDCVVCRTDAERREKFCQRHEPHSA